MLIESNNQKVLALIFKYPTTGLTIREMSRKLKISPPTVSRIAKDLERKNLVTIKKESNQYKVLGNVENEKFKDLKRIYNLFSLLSLKDFLIKELNDNPLLGTKSFYNISIDSDLQGKAAYSDNEQLLSEVRVIMAKLKERVK